MKKGVSIENGRIQDETFNATLFKKGLTATLFKKGLTENLSNEVVGVINRRNGLHNPFQKRLDRK